MVSYLIVGGTAGVAEVLLSFAAGLQAHAGSLWIVGTHGLYKPGPILLYTAGGYAWLLSGHHFLGSGVLPSSTLAV